MWETLSLKIRRRETPFWAALYNLAKRLRHLNVPVIRPLARLLYRERLVRLALWKNFWRVFYHEPLFKSRCKSVGRGLRLLGGQPLVLGNLEMTLGHDVTLHGVSTFSGSKLVDVPRLTIGDHTHLGYAVGIAVGAEVTIGSRVLIANRVSIMGWDLHPVDPVLRQQGALPSAEGLKPVVIEDDVWIGSGVTILKNVHIGRAAIVGAGAVVTKDVPAYSLVAGNPARVVKSLR